MISLPFTRDEEAWFCELLTEGAGGSLSGGADTLIMREIVVQQKFRRSRIEDIESRRKIDGVDWTTLSDGMRQPHH